MNKSFFIDYAAVLQRLQNIDPFAYMQQRNFLAGSVMRLSPFITHGVINIRQVALIILSKHDPTEVEKCLFQLAWREFFHRTWQVQKQAIFADMRQPQPQVLSTQMPTALIEAKTGIKVIDQAINDLYSAAYMHNHARMWCAAIVCNQAKTDWRAGAKWLHYHLLDGDLASNTLSWQWVAGTFSNKPYIANQDNVNKYSESQQQGTFLDVDYTELAELPLPTILQERQSVQVASQLNNDFAAADLVSTVQQLPSSGDTVVLYHPYNLDPLWHKTTAKPVKRILLIEPELYQHYPLSSVRWQFVKHWAAQINGLEIFIGSLGQLFIDGVQNITIYHREYPLTNHWPGIVESREWLFPEVEGEFSSFFKYWRQAKPGLAKL